MNKFVTVGLVLVGGLALNACSLNSLTGKREMIKIVKSEKADSIPEWYVNTPDDEKELIYGSGTGLSSDLQFSMDKAMHQAKVVLGDKISNSVSMTIKSYTADDSSKGLGGVAVEETTKVSKSGYSKIDVSEYDVVDKAVTVEGMSFRTYVLLKVNPKGRKNQTVVVDQAAVNKAREKARVEIQKLD